MVSRSPVWDSQVDSSASTKFAFAGLSEMGGTALEPVTPSLSSMPGSSTLEDEVRQRHGIRRFVGSQEKAVMVTFGRVVLTIADMRMRG
jgi:hypothetical protein